eukprot:scaffold7925_cov229-Pinguiococcus_pyrenoidosus.AAC.2
MLAAVAALAAARVGHEREAPHEGYGEDQQQESLRAERDRVSAELVEHQERPNLHHDKEHQRQESHRRSANEELHERAAEDATHGNGQSEQGCLLLVDRTIHVLCVVRIGRERTVAPPVLQEGEAPDQKAVAHPMHEEAGRHEEVEDGVPDQHRDRQSRIAVRVHFVPAAPPRRRLGDALQRQARYLNVRIVIVADADQARGQHPLRAGALEEARLLGSLQRLLLVIVCKLGHLRHHHLRQIQHQRGDHAQAQHQAARQPQDGTEAVDADQRGRRSQAAEDAQAGHGVEEQQRKGSLLRAVLGRDEADGWVGRDALRQHAEAVAADEHRGAQAGLLQDVHGQPSRRREATREQHGGREASTEPKQPLGGLEARQANGVKAEAEGDGLQQHLRADVRKRPHRLDVGPRKTIAQHAVQRLRQSQKKHHEAAAPALAPAFLRRHRRRAALRV